MSGNNFLSTRSLRLQLIIAFSLMSVIPILALLNFVLPSFFPRIHFDIVVFTVIGMAIIGFLLTKGIVDPIVKISSEVKIIANGEVSRKCDTSRDDEIGELSKGVNQLAQRIKDQMDELKIYGERSKVINAQVKQHTSALSALLQISSLVASGAELGEIFEMAMVRLSQISSSSIVFLISKNEEGLKISANFGFSAEILEAVKKPENNHIFDRLFSVSPFLKIDSALSSNSTKDLLGLLNVKNILVFPIGLYKKNVSVLGVGNPLDSFKYSEADIDLVKVFSRQLAIALENNLLQSKVSDLQSRDTVTGLYNRSYIAERLQEEISRAIFNQRPCSFILLKIDNLQDIRSAFGDLTVASILAKISATLTDSISFLDRVGRIEDNEFGIILPERNKKQAQELSKKVREKVGKAFYRTGSRKKPQVSISVTENPVDGATSSILIEKAERL